MSNFLTAGTFKSPNGIEYTIGPKGEFVFKAGDVVYYREPGSKGEKAYNVQAVSKDSKDEIDVYFLQDEEGEGVEVCAPFLALRPASPDAFKMNTTWKFLGLPMWAWAGVAVGAFVVHKLTKKTTPEYA
jgi:hypothetical protein